MNPMKPPRGAPEVKVRTRIKKYLEERGWLVMITVGNAFQSGFPDLYVAHPEFGDKWIEVKYAERYKFTAAQKHSFPRMESFGVGIWILTDGTYNEYIKLFAPPNWREYDK